MARSKAYLFSGVEIRWSCDPELLRADAITPAEETLHFPGGLADFLAAALKDRKTITPAPFRRRSAVPRASRAGRMGHRLARRMRKASSTPTATPCRRPQGGTP